MKYLFIFFILNFYSTLIFAQTDITGVVKDKKDQPIVGANVYIKDSYDGASTNLNGEFKFNTEASGIQHLIIAFIGYKSETVELNLDAQQEEIVVVLKEEINQLNAVEITAGSFSASEEVKREVLKPVDIVTTAGATADIAGALNTMPGTQTVGEEGRLFVRGGTGNETKTYIDGMQVLNPYNSSIPNTPGRARFSPMMFKGASFSTGGYSAEYGQALSSALILDTKGIPLIDRVDFGIMSVGLSAAVTKKWDNSSLLAKIQYTNLTPYFKLVKQKIEMEQAPYSWDSNFAYRQKTSKTGMIKLYGNFNQSFLVSKLPTIDEPDTKVRYEIDNHYNYLNATFQELINKKWSLKSGLSYTNNFDKIGIEKEQIEEVENGLHVKSTWSYDPNSSISFHFGGEFFYRNYEQSFSEKIVGSPTLVNFDENIFAGFSELQYYVSNNLVVRAGVRFEHNDLNSTEHLSPRLSLAYKLGTNGQFSLATGRFSQTVNNEYFKINTTLKNEFANHYIINYQWMNEGQIFRAEAYYKNYSDLIKYPDGAQYQASELKNLGTGYARGLDLFWRDNKTFQNVDYWISYSFLDTERDYKDFPQSAVPTFASKHNFSFVYKHFVTAIKSQLGFTYTYGSGRPYHNPNETGFNAGMTRSYQDLSMNISYLWKSNIIIHASVTNVLGRENVFGYEYGSQMNEYGEYNSRPIEAMAPRFIFLGAFITLSKEKTLNELPNL